MVQETSIANLSEQLKQDRDFFAQRSFTMAQDINVAKFNSGKILDKLLELTEDTQAEVQRLYRKIYDLTSECYELKVSNSALQAENDRLRRGITQLSTPSRTGDLAEKNATSISPDAKTLDEPMPHLSGAIS